MTTILCNRGDENEVIEESKQEWLQAVLLALGLPKEFFEEDIDGNDARQIMDTFGIDVWRHVNGRIDIFRKEKLVAQWFQPKLVLIKDKKEWYYQIETKEWALPFQMSNRGEK